MRVTLCWTFLRLSLYQTICPPLAAPRWHPTQERDTKRNSAVKHHMDFQWLTLPSLHVRFTAVSKSSGHIYSPTEQHVQLAAMVQTLLAEVVENPPVLLALHTQARTLCFQFTPDPLLSPAARRTLIRALRDRSVSAAWTGTGLLRIRSD